MNPCKGYPSPLSNEIRLILGPAFFFIPSDTFFYWNEQKFLLIVEYKYSTFKSAKGREIKKL